MNPYRAEQEQILIIGFNGWVLGLHPSTGDIVWQDEIGGTAVRLVVTGDRIYAASNEGVVALEYPSGKRLWRTELNFADTLMLVGDRLYVSANGVVECLTTAGSRVFRNGFPGKGHGPVAMAFAGQVVQGDVSG